MDKNKSFLFSCIGKKKIHQDLIFAYKKNKRILICVLDGHGSKKNNTIYAVFIQVFLRQVLDSLDKLDYLGSDNVVNIIKESNNNVIKVGLAHNVGATIVGLIIDSENNALEWFNAGDSIGMTITENHYRRHTALHNPEKESHEFKNKYKHFIKGKQNYTRLKRCRLSASIGDSDIANDVPEYKRIATKVQIYDKNKFEELNIVIGVDGEYLEVRDTRKYIFNSYKKHKSFDKVFNTLVKNRDKYENNTVLFMDLTDFLNKTKDLSDGYFQLWKTIDKLNLDDYFYQIHYKVFEFTEFPINDLPNSSSSDLSYSSTSW